ncbi:MAG: OadG family protein [bacterium]|nr:OadG family protein [bacterium]
MIKVGLTLLIMGMGTVFSFLVILIFTMGITYKVLGVINKFFPEVAVEAAPVKKVSASDDAEIAVAIAATKRL